MLIAVYRYNSVVLQFICTNCIIRFIILHIKRIVEPVFLLPGFLPQNKRYAVFWVGSLQFLKKQLL